MKIKKWMALLLATVMLVSLAACSSSGSSKKSSKEGDMVTVCLITRAEGTDFFTTMKYDDHGNLLQIAEYNDGTECVRDEYEYDADGKLIEWVSYWFNEIHYQETYTYDENGNLIQSCKSYADGPEYISEYEYEHDEDGNLIQTRKTAYDGYEEVFKYTYDKNGNLIKEDGDHGVTEYTYNEDGNVTKTVGYDNTEYIYDEKGRITRMVTYYDGIEAMQAEIVYENGFPTKMIQNYGESEEELSLTCTTVQMTEQQFRKKQAEFYEGNGPWVIILK